MHIYRQSLGDYLPALRRMLANMRRLCGPKGRNTMHSTPMGSDNSIALAAVPAAVRQARSFATETLKSWGLPPDAIDTIVLLVSELAANALARPKTSITHMDEPETFTQFSVQLAC